MHPGGLQENSVVGVEGGLSGRRFLWLEYTPFGSVLYLSTFFRMSPAIMETVALVD